MVNSTIVPCMRCARCAGCAYSAAQYARTSQRPGPMTCTTRGRRQGKAGEAGKAASPAFPASQARYSQNPTGHALTVSNLRQCVKSDTVTQNSILCKNTLKRFTFNEMQARAAPGSGCAGSPCAGIVLAGAAWPCKSFRFNRYRTSMLRKGVAAHPTPSRPERAASPGQSSCTRGPP